MKINPQEEMEVPIDWITWADEDHKKLLNQPLMVLEL